MRRWSLGAIALVATIASTPAAAGICGTVSFTSPSAVTGWNPLTTSTGTTSFTATVTRAAKSTRTAQLIFLDKDSGPTALGSVGTQIGPDYAVRWGSTLVSAPVGSTPPPTSSSAAEYSWNGNESLNVAKSASFAVTVQSRGNQEFVGNTSYVETLRYVLRCYQSSGGNETSDAVGNAVTVTLAVPSLLSVITAAPSPIDFGSFTSTTATTAIGLRSTASVDVRVTTLFGSQLVKAGAASPYPVNMAIPYTMLFNGVAVTTSASATSLPRAKVVGSSWPFVLTLVGGLPTGKVAGDYSDTITLTMTPGI